MHDLGYISLRSLCRRAFNTEITEFSAASVLENLWHGGHGGLATDSLPV